jgi:hypothetical protein
VWKTAMVATKEHYINEALKLDKNSLQGQFDPGGAHSYQLFVRALTDASLQATVTTALQRQTGNDLEGRARDGDEAAQRLVANRAGAQTISIEQREREADSRKFFENNMRTLAAQAHEKLMIQLEEDLDTMADFLRERLARINLEIKGKQKEVQEILEQHEGAKPAIRGYHEKGYLDRDKDGNLLNRDLQKIYDRRVKNTELKPIDAVPQTDGALVTGAEEQEKHDTEKKIQPLQKLQEEGRTTEADLKTVEGYAKRIEEARKKEGPEKNAAMEEIARELQGNPILRQIQRRYQDEVTLTDAIKKLSFDEDSVEQGVPSENSTKPAFNAAVKGLEVTTSPALDSGDQALKPAQAADYKIK